MNDYNIPDSELRCVTYLSKKKIHEMESNTKKMKSLSWPEKGLFAMQLSKENWKETSFDILKKYDAEKPEDFIDIYENKNSFNQPYGTFEIRCYLIRGQYHLYYITFYKKIFDNGKIDEYASECEDEAVFSAMMLPLAE